MDKKAQELQNEYGPILPLDRRADRKASFNFSKPQQLWRSERAPLWGEVPGARIDRQGPGPPPRLHFAPPESDSWLFEFYAL